MLSYPSAALERAMKVQEVILRAISKRLSFQIDDSPVFVALLDMAEIKISSLMAA